MTNNKNYYNMLIDKRLTSNDKVLYSYIWMKSNFEGLGYCDKSNKELQKLLSINSSATLTKSIKSLRELNYIIQVDNKKTRQEGLFTTQHGESYRHLYPVVEDKATKAKQKIQADKKANELKEFSDSFESFWKKVLYKETKAMSLKKLVKMKPEERELVMSSYLVLQSREKDNFRTKMSNFIGKELYKDEVNHPEHLAKGQKTEAQKKREDIQEMLRDDFNDIRVGKNNKGEHVDTVKLKKWMLTMYNSGTYNKVKELINKLYNN